MSAVEYCGGPYQGDLPDAGEGACCVGSAMGGPNDCTCWEEVYDLDQAPVDADSPAGVQPRLCVDCAYRPDSPDRRGEEHVTGDQELLETLVETATPFWCHQGIRRVVALRHVRTGTLFAPEDGSFAAAYRPPQRAGRPYKADGSCGDLCAGWTARLLAKATR